MENRPIASRRHAETEERGGPSRSPRQATLLTVPKHTGVTILPIEALRPSWLTHNTTGPDDEERPAEFADAPEQDGAESALEDAVETRLQRFGQELHDGIAQHLTAVSFLLGAARAQDGASGVLRDILSDAGGVLETAIEETQRMAKHLFPVAIEHGGLEWALASLAEGVSKSAAIRCELQTVPSGDRPDPYHKRAPLPTTTATHLYRIAQEAVNNAVKHGHAKEVRIQLLLIGDVFELAVCDNGEGFDPDGIVPGLGLESMRRRTRVLKGSLSIRPGEHGTGTVVRCRIPLSDGLRE